MLVPPNFMTRRLVILVCPFPAIGSAIANDFQQRRFHLVDAEAGGIDVDRIGSLNQRRYGTGAITLIAFAQLLLHDVGRKRCFLCTAGGPLLRLSIEEYLYGRVRKYDR